MSVCLAEPELIDAPVSARDWQAEAWRRIQARTPRFATLTLDQALSDRHIGRSVRAFAAYLRRKSVLTQYE
jgi:hypothetical protein